jgi:protein subunit release factor A
VDADDNIRIDHYRTAAGVDAIRAVHLPTGISVTIDGQPTVEANRRRAIELLRVEVQSRGE